MRCIIERHPKQIGASKPEAKHQAEANRDVAGDMLWVVVSGQYGLTCCRHTNDGDCEEELLPGTFEDINNKHVGRMFSGIGECNKKSDAQGRQRGHPRIEMAKRVEYPYL